MGKDSNLLDSRSPIGGEDMLRRSDGLKTENANRT